MPLYDYRCASCGEVTEVRHGFEETYTEPCPKCGGVLGRLFNPAGIVFKGSGFYITDSRQAGAGKSDSSGTGGTGSSDSGGSPPGGNSGSGGSKESAA